MFAEGLEHHFGIAACVFSGKQGNDSVEAGSVLTLTSAAGPCYPAQLEQ